MAHSGYTWMFFFFSDQQHESWYFNFSLNASFKWRRIVQASLPRLHTCTNPSRIGVWIFPSESGPVWHLWIRDGEASTPYHLEAQDRAMQNRPEIICVIHLYKSLFQRTDSSFQSNTINKQDTFCTFLYSILTIPFSLSSPSFPIKRTFYLPHLPGWRRCCAPRRKISKRRVDQRNDQSKPASMRPDA